MYAIRSYYELRRALEKMGRAKVSNFNVFSMGNDLEENEIYKWNVAINAIVDATSELSSTVITSYSIHYTKLYDHYCHQ